MRGPHVHVHRVYALWGSLWNLVDRINEDYHNYFQLHGSKSANAFALESVAHIVMMAARAIWEEHRCVHAYDRSNRNNAAAANVQRVDIPHFLLRAAQAATNLPD